MEVEWVVFNRAYIPVVRTRNHRRWACQISYDIFARGARRRAQIRIPTSVEAERFISMYLRKLALAGLIELTDEGFTPLVSAYSALEFHRHLREALKYTTVREIAERVGVTPSAVKYWLSTGAIPTRVDFNKVLRAAEEAAREGKKRLVGGV